jgi:hypothetical protein
MPIHHDATAETPRVRFECEVCKRKKTIDCHGRTVESMRGVFARRRWTIDGEKCFCKDHAPTTP